MESKNSSMRLILASASSRRADLLRAAGFDFETVAADVVDGMIPGKTRDDKESDAMLRRLSGRRHEVTTGISLRAGSRERRHVETTAVYFATLSDYDVAWYVRSGEGRDKAGAYAIQGLGSRFIPRIEGSYTNVVGLPIAALCELIRSI